MTTVPGVWAQARAARPARPPRTPVLLLLVAWVGAHLPAWAKVRTTVLQLAAFGFLDYAVFTYVGHGWGYAAIGVTLLVLEALSGDRPRR